MWSLMLILFYHYFQVAELRVYLKSKGAEISEENSADGLITDLAKVIAASEILIKDGSGTEAGLRLINNYIRFINQQSLI